MARNTNMYNENTPQSIKNEKMENYQRDVLKVKVKSSTVPDEWQVPHDLRSVILEQIWP